MAVFVVLCRVVFRKAFAFQPDKAQKVMQLNERDAIKDPRLLLISGGVLLLATAAFVLHTWLHQEPSIVAIIGGLLLLALSKLDAEAVARDVEWPTLVFFAGLFIMVGALVNTGVIGKISEAATDAVGGKLWPASMVLLWGSAFLSAIVDNIPYVATMSPIVADLVSGFPKGEGNVLWWALALGADLGGNATAIGASANVVILGMAERAGKPISFWQFTKYGLIVTAITIALCVPYLWLRYFAFA
jgi:Na+/H+ antiporter NhaD/arsenite permease-like protein